MQEILRHLRAGTFVLDLGCSQGSFTNESTAAHVVRLDLETPRHPDGTFFVQGDSARLPFADHTFAAVIANHSLEHLNDLQGSLREIRRVLAPRGCLFVSVPDASTFTDKLYRWLAHGGGHVNPFTSDADVVQIIERATGLRHSATRTLCSSLSFLNRRNSPHPRPRRLLALGGGSEWSLFFYAWASRRIDRIFHLRTSIYGWAFYFGDIPEPVDTGTLENVCLRCGQGCPSPRLQQLGAVRTAWIGSRFYICPACSALNPFCEG